MTGMLRVPRSRGALSGLLLILLGLWGGLVAFVGPYFHFAYTPDDPWVFTADRFWLHVLPAIATVLGGIIVLGSANRAFAVLGAWLAALGGAWYVVGEPVSRLWVRGAGAGAAGTPVGGEVRQVVEQLTFFLALGALIIFFAALALGRFTVVGVKERRLLEEERAVAEAPPVHGRHERAPQEPVPAGWSETQPMHRPGAEPARPAEPAERRTAEPARETTGAAQTAGRPETVRTGGDAGEPPYRGDGGDGGAGQHAGEVSGGRYARPRAGAGAPSGGTGGPDDRWVAGRSGEAPSPRR